MFEVIIGTLLTVMGTGLLSVFAWAVRLSNKVAVIEAEQNNVRNYIKDRFDELVRRLERIERKLDHTEE